MEFNYCKCNKIYNSYYIDVLKNVKIESCYCIKSQIDNLNKYFDFYMDEHLIKNLNLKDSLIVDRIKYEKNKLYNFYNLNFTNHNTIFRSYTNDTICEDCNLHVYRLFFTHVPKWSFNQWFVKIDKRKLQLFENDLWIPKNEDELKIYQNFNS